MTVYNKQGGIDPDTKEGLERAKEVDLVTFSKDIDGANCANCKFVKILDKKQGIGYCAHPEVQLPVTKRQCCSRWDQKGTLRAWQKK